MDAAQLRLALTATEGLEPRPPAAPKHVAAFELRFGITLPALFRTFVLEVADGLVYDGASWLYSLDEIAADVSDDALVARPFWYGDAQAAALRTAVAAASSAGDVFSPEVLALQRGGRPDGCLTLANNGGNDFSVLVVTGEQAGFVWRTGELDFPESRSLYHPGSSDDSPLDFRAWLALWGECFLGLRVQG